MLQLKRFPKNPILLPNPENSWEAEAVFNGCVIKERGKFHLVYRALSSPQRHQGRDMRVSSIGYAISNDGIHFEGRRQFIIPEYDWEIFGCEDPRITKIDGKYYIFYTALSTYPFKAESIKVGVAITKDFKTIEAKYPVTNFNSKAMALFPRRINKKLVAVLTGHTDMPPAKIAIASFDKEKEIWRELYWQKWYASFDEHVIPLLRTPYDHLEIGAPPIKTEAGWLLIYSYIKNYLSSPRVFGIEALLLKLNNPLKVVGRTRDPVLVPEAEYELQGKVPNVVFPSGALVHKEKLYVYYGAADTTCCLAICNLKKLLKELKPKRQIQVVKNKEPGNLERFAANPIITPRPEFAWEAKATFNPAAIYLNSKIHLVYRAMSNDNTSVLGYAASRDGFRVEERLPHSIYRPRENFEMKRQPGNSGCEDPRLTKIGNRLYMLYTAFNGVNPPRIALTFIKVKDFLAGKWNWAKPILISPPGVDDKDGCIFPKKIKGKYLILHRFGDCVCVDFVKDLKFENNQWLEHETSLMKPRPDRWDNRKIGIAGPPIETKDGWLLIYHGISEPGRIYKLGVALLKLDDPTQVVARTDYPILEPEMNYEKKGQVSNVIFSCGAVVIKNQLFVYYGGADKVVGVVVANLNRLLRKMKNGYN